MNKTDADTKAHHTPVLSCVALHCPALPCLALPCLVLSCLVLSQAGPCSAEPCVRPSGLRKGRWQSTTHVLLLTASTRSSHGPTVQTHAVGMPTAAICCCPSEPRTFLLGCGGDDTSHSHAAFPSETCEIKECTELHIPQKTLASCLVRSVARHGAALPSVACPGRGMQATLPFSVRLRAPLLPNQPAQTK